MHTFAKIKRDFMDEKRPFQRGDIIVKTSSQDWFAIYDGAPANSLTSYVKRYTLALSYDKYKYQKNEETGVYERMPHLSYATATTPCDETIDECKETFWYEIADEDTELEVLKKLADMGLHWDKETLTLSNIETGEVIKQLKAQVVKYDGTEIKPSTGFLDSICACVSKLQPSKPSSAYSDYAEYEEYYNRYGYFE